MRSPLDRQDGRISHHMPMALLTRWSGILQTDFQIPEVIRGYIGLIDLEVLRSIGVFLIFVMVLIVLRRVRNLRDEVAALQEFVREMFTIGQSRSLAEPRGSNPAETALKLAVTETELKALRDMVTELRQARDDWKAQTGSLVRAAAPITPRAPAVSPSALAPAPAAVEPERDLLHPGQKGGANLG
jgi:hypothetical protein